MIPVQFIEHVALQVANIDESVKWYAETLGLERRYQEFTGDDVAMMWAGQTYLGLFQMPPEEAHVRQAPVEVGRRMLHFSFRIADDMFEKAKDELDRRGLTYQIHEREVTRALYLRDPDGYEIELATFEPDRPKRTG
jgi:catechol 2,3-dioxygenase-like lactoylglutathione lyase family enzyme